MKRKKVAVIGVGLLGGSLALALKRTGRWKVVGWNHRATSRRRAAKILTVARSLEDAVRGADAVVLCAHTKAVLSMLCEITPWLGKNTLVMDVSSLKGPLVREAARIPGIKGRFVPCHPMAGKEKSGPEASDKDLYRGKYVFVTPFSETKSSTAVRAAAFWKSLGARVLFWTPQRHDQRVALTSHLPHLLACVMMERFGLSSRKDSQLKAAVGTGFRDFTRIAAGNPAMWADILTLNAPEISKALGLFRKRLQALEKDVRAKRRSKWLRFFENARTLREKL